MEINKYDWSLEEILAICLLNAGRLDDAARLLESLNLDKNSMSSYLLGVTYVRQKNYEKASRAFRKVSPDNLYYINTKSFMESYGALTDDPYTNLHLGHRKKAADFWEDALKKNPKDPDIWHNLAVLYYWEANHLEEGCIQDAILYWRKAIGYWSGVFASEDFWKDFAIQRAPALGIREANLSKIGNRFKIYSRDQKSNKDEIENYIANIAEARDEMENRILNHFADKIGDETLKMELKQYYRQLLIEFSLELSVARLLETSKKIHCIMTLSSIPNTIGISQILEYLRRAGSLEHHELDRLLSFIELELHIGPSDIDIPSCGPIMLESLGLSDEAREFVDSSSKTVGTMEIHKLLKRQMIPYYAKLLKFYLNPELGRLLAMIDVEMFNEATHEIMEKLQRGYTEHNFKLLLALACFSKARYMLVGRKYLCLASILETAVRLAYFESMMDSSPFSFSFPKLMEDIQRDVIQSVDWYETDVYIGINIIERLSEMVPTTIQDTYNDILKKLKLKIGEHNERSFGT